MFFQRKTIPGLAINSYIVGDEAKKECVVIDPVRDVEDYIALAAHNGFTITDILETHVHADFVSGAPELKARLKGNPKIHCSGMGGDQWIPSYADHVMQDGDEINVGSLVFKAEHTPGHTPEHVMWALYEDRELVMLLTGDFLFVGDVGRPDLLGKEEMRKLAHQLYDSVFRKLESYPDETEIRPAHGAGSLCGKALSANPSSTLGEQRKTNRYLKKIPESDWIDDLMSEMPQAPKYFARMKKINITGAKILGERLPGLVALSLKDIQKEMDHGTIILDLRPKEKFAEAHIPGSINIPFTPQFSSWAGSVMPENAHLVLLLDDLMQLKDAAKALCRIGIDQILGYIPGGIEAWKQNGMGVASLQKASPTQLNQMQKSGKNPFVLDVRADKEWKAGHIKHATHIPLGQVEDQIEKIPKDQTIAVICGSGTRSSIASSLLLRHGINNVTNIFGGMTEWKEKGFPIEM